MKSKLRHMTLVAAFAAGSILLPSSAFADQTRSTNTQPSATFRSLAQPLEIPSRVQTFDSRAQNYERYAQKTISYAQAKSIALRSRPGSKYVGMRLNGNTYVVRLETSNGRVIDVRVDATTGRVR